MTASRRPHGGLFLKLLLFLKKTAGKNPPRFRVSEATGELGESDDSLRKALERRFLRDGIVQRAEAEGGAGAVIYEITEAGRVRLDALLKEVLPPFEPQGPEVVLKRLYVQLQDLGPASDKSEREPSERRTLLDLIANDVRLRIPAGADAVVLDTGETIDRRLALAWLGFEEAVQDLLLGRIGGWLERFVGANARLLVVRAGAVAENASRQVELCDTRYQRILTRFAAITRAPGFRAEDLPVVLDGLNRLPTLLEDRLASGGITERMALPEEWERGRLELVSSLRLRPVSSLGPQILFLKDSTPFADDIASKVVQSICVTPIERLEDLVPSCGRPEVVYIATGSRHWERIAEQVKLRNPAAHRILVVDKFRPEAQHLVQRQLCESLIVIRSASEVLSDVDRSSVEAKRRFRIWAEEDSSIVLAPPSTAELVEQVRRRFDRVLCQIDEQVAVLENRLAHEHATALDRRALDAIAALGSWRDTEFNYEVRLKLARAFDRHGGEHVRLARGAAYDVLGESLPLARLTLQHQARKDALVRALRDRSTTKPRGRLERFLDSTIAKVASLLRKADTRRLETGAYFEIYALAERFVRAVNETSAFAEARAAIHGRGRPASAVQEVHEFLCLSPAYENLEANQIVVDQLGSLASDQPGERVPEKALELENKALLGRLLISNKTPRLEMSPQGR